MSIADPTPGGDAELIAAAATPPGQGGVGIVRLSGAGAHDLAASICTKPLQPRVAVYCDFRVAGEVIDQGLAIWFPGDASFTGEEVVELQAHGSPVVLQMLLNQACAAGARLARPGEFSERAFTNGKMDLAQAEAVADLIASASAASARAAARSLRGDFSARIEVLSTQLVELRLLVEAAIDFPDEEDVDLIGEHQVGTRTDALIELVQALLETCRQGQLLAEGITIAIVGTPNVGKSSLLNTLSGEETAIVTDIPGTTRDLLKVDLVIEGLPVRLVDTAGVRHSADAVEQMGVARAVEQARTADLVLALSEVGANGSGEPGMDGHRAEDTAELRSLIDVVPTERLVRIMNKIDLLTPDELATARGADDSEVVWLSALAGSGIEELKRVVRDRVGGHADAPFTARMRHIEALQVSLEHLDRARAALEDGNTLEFAAEELRLAHDALATIVGQVTPDDLLGKIFSEFCIGK